MFARQPGSTAPVSCALHGYHDVLPVGFTAQVPQVSAVPAKVPEFTVAQGRAAVGFAVKHGNMFGDIAAEVQVPMLPPRMPADWSTFCVVVPPSTGEMLNSTGMYHSTMPTAPATG